MFSTYPKTAAKVPGYRITVDYSIPKILVGELPN